MKNTTHMNLNQSMISMLSMRCGFNVLLVVRRLKWMNLMTIVNTIRKMKMNNYTPKWHCTYCGSYDVETIEHARFNPNKDYEFVESCEIHVMDWCNDCDGETSFDECEKHYEESNTHKPTCDTEEPQDG
jgi:hypothetical protein